MNGCYKRVHLNPWWKRELDDWSHVLGIVRASSVAVIGSEMWFNVFNPDGISYPLPHSSAGYQETVVVNASSKMSFMSPADAAPTSSCD